jgi:peptidoglycan/LPS O-acetylase OafA/YrhL
MFWAMKLPKGYVLAKRKKYFLVLPITIVLCCLLVFVRMNKIIPYFTGISVDGILAVAISVLIILLLRNVPILSASLSFLGKHSANIYMVHTFLFSYWLSEFIYAPKYAVLIFLLLLVCSLLISIVLEFIKSKFGFYKISDIVIKRIDAL